MRISAAHFQGRIAQLIRNVFAVVFAVSPPLIEAGLKFEQIVRNRIHRIPPKIRSGIDGNDSRNGAQKSGAIAESGGLQRTVRGSTHKPFTLSTDGCRRHETVNLIGLPLASFCENAFIEELSQHLDDCHDELVGGGATEALPQTLAELGGNELPVQELSRTASPFTKEPFMFGTQRKTNLLASWWQDMRVGARML